MDGSHTRPGSDDIKKLPHVDISFMNYGYTGVMAKHAWFDKLWGLRHLGQTDTPASEGLVLSGGGSRASFHIGALRYLYENSHIAPRSIVSTSAGSIVAAMLAQSLDPGEQLTNLGILEDYWMAMTDPSEMFTEQAWFTRLREQWGEISSVIPEPVISDPIFDSADSSTAEHLVKQAIAMDPSTQDSDFSLPSFWRLLGALPRIGKIGAGLANTLHGAERAASAYRPGPIVQRLLFESGFSATAVAQSGVQLRMAFVGLKTGDLRFMRQDGFIVDTDDQLVDLVPYDISLGVWASCALPGVFRPVVLGDDAYVDGGVRDNVPVEMAVSTLGVTKPYVIAATPPGVGHADLSSTDMVSVLMRTFSILVDEAIRDEVAWARRAGAVVIEPEVDVHASMVVDNTLMRINRDYGWMCAAEEMTNPDTRVSGPITLARMELYRVESSPDSELLAPDLSHPDAVHAVLSPVAPSSGSSTGPDPASNGHGISAHLNLPFRRIDTVEDAASPISRDDLVRSAREHLRTLLDCADPALLPSDYRSWPEE